MSTRVEVSGTESSSTTNLGTETATEREAVRAESVRAESAPRYSRRRFGSAALFAPAAALSMAAPVVLAATSAGARRFRRLSPADRVELVDLLARYHWALDCGDEDEFIATFTPDATVIAFGNESARGHAAIREWVRYLWRMRESDGIDWQHLSDHHRFDGAAPACTVYSYWTVIRSRAAANDHGVRSIGHYVNDCVKQSGEWRLQTHRLFRWNGRALPWAGGA